jgi:hypothetical protein
MRLLKQIYSELPYPTDIADSHSIFLWGDDPTLLSEFEMRRPTKPGECTG